MYERYDRQTSRLTAADGTMLAFHVHAAPSTRAHPTAAALPVLLTNGVSTTENFWRHLVDALAPSHALVHWDYRGHGQSGLSPVVDYRLETLAEDLIQVTEAAFGERRPVVHVAFSMGVMVLLEAYRRRPELFRALVLIAGGAEAPAATSLPLRLPGAKSFVRTTLKAMAPLVPAFQPVARRLFRSPKAVDVAKGIGVLQPHAPREDIEQLLAGLQRMDLGAYWRMLRGLFESDLSSVLPTVSAPTLVIGHEADWFAPGEQMTEMAEAIPGSRYVSIPHAGHAGLVEEGPTLAAHVAAFLGALPR